MKNAMVFLVEDNESTVINLMAELERAGHGILPIVGNSLATTMEVINRDLLGRWAVNAAIVDGNLTKGDMSCADGKTVAAAIRRKYPHIKIIAFSTCTRDVADYGDVYTDGSVSPVKLIEEF